MVCHEDHRFALLEVLRPAQVGLEKEVTDHFEKVSRNHFNHRG
jgi:hypothetical protein